MSDILDSGVVGGVDPRKIFCFDDNRSECKDVTCEDKYVIGGSFEVRVYSEIQDNSLLVWDATEFMSSGGNLDVMIEFSRTGVDGDDADWSVVQDWIPNTGIWADPEQRLFGTFHNGYYRVSVRTPDGRIIRSKPVRGGDYLPPNLKKVYREMRRRWFRRGKQNELRRGYLLKFNRYGNRCSVCRDRDSGVQIRSQCLECYGTGRERGYFLVPWCVYAEMGTDASTEKFTVQSDTQSVDPKVQFRLLDNPHILPKDVWVDENTDQRWLFESVAYPQVLGSTPVFAVASAAKLDFTHVIYRFQVPGRL
ncbi:MAG: hypothetical protein KatS3mg109_0029 [Pirellulaceae bacterium]|nr:MAG: hypothetical protein KatS3mg109_0029 [Pirellulaceae bacterium]